MTENYFLTLVLSDLGHFHTKTRAKDFASVSVSPRGRRREPTLSPARGGWLQLPAGLRLGRDLRHGLHQQSEEGEDCLVLGLNMRFVESHHCVYMPGSLLELQNMNFAVAQELQMFLETPGLIREPRSRQWFT